VTVFSILVDCFIALFKVLPHMKLSVGWLRLKNHRDSMIEAEKWEQCQDCPLVTGMAGCHHLSFHGDPSLLMPLKYCLCLRIFPGFLPLQIQRTVITETEYKVDQQEKNFHPFLSLKLNYGRGGSH
jgi:hypothetical protein